MIAELRGILVASRLFVLLASSVIAAIGGLSVVLLAPHIESYYVVPFVLGFVCLPMIALSDVLQGLSALVGHVMGEALAHHKMPGRLYLVDSKPIPVCKLIRHGRVRLLRPEGAYFGKSSTGWYFGYKLPLLVHHSGAILYALLTPAN